jgi:probable rRNA maturation factor
VAEVAAIDLDLAYSADPDLAPELLAAAGSWCAAADAEAAWHQLLAGWLQQLQAELPVKLQGPAYSLGLSLLGDVLPGDGLPPMPMPVADGALELGDIVISLETAARQAPEHDHSLEQELLFLASHGLLHLLGWDHPDQASLTAMLQRQERLCSSVNVKVSGSSTGL